MATTVTVQRPNSRMWVMTVTETGAGSTTEVLLAATTGGAAPPAGRILRCIATHSAGAGATRRPRLGTAAGTAAGTTRYQAASAVAVATVIDEQPAVPPTFEGALYHRSQVDAAADNSMVTVYHIATGWTG